MKIFAFSLICVLVGVCLAAEFPQGKEPIYDGKTLSQWIARTKDKDGDVRLYAAWALGEFGPDAKTAVPAIMVLLKDKDQDIRRAAIGALGEIGPEAKTAIPSLIALLKDSAIRREATKALGKMGAEAASAVPPLTDLLNDKHVRWCVIEALGKIGPTAIPALTDLLKTRTRNFDEPLPKFWGRCGPSPQRSFQISLRYSQIRIRMFAGPLLWPWEISAPMQRQPFLPSRSCLRIPSTIRSPVKL